MANPKIAIQNTALLGQLRAVLGEEVGPLVVELDQLEYLEYAASAVLVNAELLGDVLADMERVEVCELLREAYKGLMTTMRLMKLNAEVVAADLERIVTLTRAMKAQPEDDECIPD